MTCCTFGSLTAFARRSFLQAKSNSLIGREGSSRRAPCPVRTKAYNTAHIYRIERGRLASFEEYPEDLYAFDEAWG